MDPRIKKRILESTDIQPTVTLLSYNIMATDTYIVERATSVVNLVRRESPDIICLQEVTRTSYAVIEEALRESYHVIQMFMELEAPVGMCLLFKRSTVTLNNSPYYYDVCRSHLIGCEIGIGGLSTNVLTTQLDSGPENENTRSMQYDIIREITKNLKSCILAGDFNLWSPTEDTESKIANFKLTDAWMAIGCPSKIKFTYNYKENNLAKQRIKRRFDRVFYFSENNALTVRKMSLVGLKPISSTVPVNPSSHFGLVVEFAT